MLTPSQVHFGVNSVSNNFAVERRAVNEATFRCPDELGWQPQVCLFIEQQLKALVNLNFYAFVAIEEASKLL